MIPFFPSPVYKWTNRYPPFPQRWGGGNHPVYHLRGEADISNDYNVRCKPSCEPGTKLVVINHSVPVNTV